jgi:hypothetical protein
LKLNRFFLLVPVAALAVMVGSAWIGAEEQASPAGKPGECPVGKAQDPQKAQGCDKAPGCPKAQASHKAPGCPMSQGSAQCQGCDAAGKHTGVLLEGQLVDMKCQLSMGAAGQGHDACAVQCAKAGMPVGLREAEKGAVYTVLTAPAGLADLMGQKVRITGTTFCKTMAIAPERIEVEKDGAWVEHKLPATPM